MEIGCVLKKEKIAIVMIIGLFAFLPIAFFITDSRSSDADSITILIGYMAIPFSGAWLLMSFMAIGDLLINDSSNLRDNAGIAFLSIFILWASFPLMFKVLKGIRLWRRILLMWMFSVQLSWPLFYMYMTITNTPMYF